MARVYVGNLDERIAEADLDADFRQFGKIHFIWVAKKPPGFAFVDFEDARDADDAVRRMNGQHGWRVEVSRKSYGQRGGPGGGDRGGYGGGGGGGGRGGGRGDMACFNCGEVGHLARDCRARGVPPMRRDRSPPRRDYSPYRRDRRRSPSPAGRGRSRSPPPRRADSRSPPPRRAAADRSPPPRRADSRSPPPRVRDRSPGQLSPPRRERSRS